MNRPQVFIEKIMPVKLLNQQVYYEHGGNPFKGLHRWYSRKPLSFSRASVLASLLPADISMEEFEYLLGLHPEKDGVSRGVSRNALTKEGKIKLYKTPPSSRIIEKLEEYCEKVWGKRKPVVLDAFAGGGSIPFEAARYGLNVLASDLNPVAVVTMKAAMEYPLKFGADLQQDIDKWVKFVGDEAQDRLAEFFPSSNSPLNKGGEGGSEKVQNYLWAHTVVCPHCESVVPLSPNWWLSKTSNYAGKGKERKVTSDWYAVKPIPNPKEKRVDFELIKGSKGQGTTIIYDDAVRASCSLNTQKNNNHKNSNSERNKNSNSERNKNSNSERNKNSNSERNKNSNSERDAHTTKAHTTSPNYIETEYDPSTTTTISRGVGKCPNCTSVIEDNVIKSQAKSSGLGHQLYAVAYKEGKGGLQFRIPTALDLDGVAKAEAHIKEKLASFENSNIVPEEERFDGYADRCIAYGMNKSLDYFNPRQLLTLVSYVEIINEAKSKLQFECEPEKVKAIATYLALVLDRCVDRNCRLSIWHTARASIERASTQHALNLTWNYPEINGTGELWHSCADAFTSDYTKLCNLFGTNFDRNQIPGFVRAFRETPLPDINASSADSLFHIPDNSVDTIVTDPPYYSTIQYAELADFFYVWQKRTLGDIFPDLFWSELTDKDREAVANPSRFRNMGASPEELAKQDYEAKMQLAFSEYYRVLRDDGVMTVQFNHKESGAWDVLTKSLIDAGFEITASWAVSTENPQNLHQAKKNSVSSTVLLVCRKRIPPAPRSSGGAESGGMAWWDDLRPEVANLVEQRAPEFEENDITGIDLYLSAFGSALNVFSRSYPILDSSGEEVRPEVAFAEARKAIANYRFRKLVQTDTAGFDPLTQWYLLAWDAFKAREFPFDEARQLALAVGGFDVNDLAKTYKLLASKSGNCTILTPKQRHKKRAFSADADNFSNLYLVDALHAIIAIYQEEQNPQLVRNFMHKTGLNNNDMLIKTLEIAFKVMPTKTEEHKTLTSIWLSMDEIKAKVIYEQKKLF